MSTFNGIIEEFPRIRIDYFRKNPDRPPPLACFLSHVHSDHLSGLESLRSPFIYCSAATREILLRIEKYPHRMNFSKGILESRKQHYKHLENLLRPVPLQVPTEIELTPRSRIRVTLFDANHCIGAVMFLIEGDGKAVLYTGDIRAEPWWVNSMVRNPVLIPYTLGNKRIDKIYLDTTFATKSNIYKTFPSKAEGIQELLQKIEKYPEDTVFYLRSWTFGYEEVWQALSAALNTPIHVDRYQIGLYKSLAVNYGAGFGIHEAPYLYGFRLGNSRVPGCLTNNEDSRLHSCEPGMLCSAISSRPSVFICPIVNRADDGSKVPEHGVGGGGGDLYQSHELELPDKYTLQQLEILCREQIKDETVLAKTLDALSSAFNSESKTLSLVKYGLKAADEIPLKELVRKLSRGKTEPVKDLDGPSPTAPSGMRENGNGLPKSIEFPYSRHSSYGELLDLVEAFKPKDLFPCTVDKATWRDEVSMQNLFGHLCSGKEFAHDRHMREIIMDEDGERPRKMPKATPEPEETQSRELLESASQSFVSSTDPTDSHPSKEGERPRSPDLPKPPISTDGDDIRSIRTPERGIKRTHDTISSSQSSSLSSPQVAKHRALVQALRNKAPRKEIDNQPIPQNRKSPSPVQQLQNAIGSETEGDEEEEEEEVHEEGEEQATQIKLESQKIDIIEISDDEDLNDMHNINTEDQNTHGPNNNEEDTEPEIESQSTIISYSIFGSQHDSQSGIITSPKSLRRRAEAYKVARSGTFSDWADYAPISSGNNHTKEEKRL